MPVNVYECMFLLDTNKVAGDVGAATKQLHTILERNQAEVLASRPWDDRRLAYPIKGHKKGLYYLTYFRTEGKNIGPIERDCALNETILRNLILHVDPKMVDMMLQVARDEHAGIALQTVTEPPAEEAAAGEGDGERPRRGGPRPPREPRAGEPREPREPRAGEPRSEAKE
jgi:small subunit ribosomal protein S6